MVRFIYSILIHFLSNSLIRIYYTSMASTIILSILIIMHPIISLFASLLLYCITYYLPTEFATGHASAAAAILIILISPLSSCVCSSIVPCFVLFRLPFATHHSTPQHIVSQHNTATHSNP